MNKSSNIDYLNEKLGHCTKELEASKNNIDILNKKVQELDSERLTAETKAVDMGNKNHELNKLLQIVKDSLNKKELVYHDYILNYTLKIEVFYKFQYIIRML